MQDSCGVLYYVLEKENERNMLVIGTYRICVRHFILCLVLVQPRKTSLDD